MSFLIRSSSYIKLRRRSVEVEPILEKPAPLDTHHFFYSADHLTSLTADFMNPVASLGRLAQMGGVEGLAKALRTDLTDGLLSDEVEEEEKTERRKKMYGVNSFKKSPPRNFFLFCLDEIKDPFLLLLTFAGVGYTIFKAVHEPEKATYVEGLAIIGAVLIVVLTASINNFTMERRFRAQSANENITEVLLMRGGREELCKSTDVLVGDLLMLSTGSAIPCDGVLVSGTEDLMCEESALTGESKAVQKNRTRPFLLAGTQVIDGEGLMIATSVGERTCWGALLMGLQERRPRTPLQKKLDKLVRMIGIVGSVFASVTFVVKLAYWVIKNKENSTYLKDFNSLILAFLTSIALIVVAIPEGLPLAVTITLSYAMRKMLKDNNFVRVLSACETMGNATTICSDKTGTLTQNRMRVVEAWPDVFEKDAEANTVEPLFEKSASEIFRNALLEGIALNSKVFELKPSEWSVPETPEYAGGNKTDCALFSWAVKLGLKEKEVRKEMPVEKAFPFSSVTKRSSVLVSRKDKFRLYMKGAAEKVLAEYCTSMLQPSGEILPLTDSDRESICLVIDGMVSRGLRCVVLAMSDFEKVKYPTDLQKISEETNLKELSLIAVVALKDPLRPDVKEAVRKCQQAGIVVRMVTGDHPKTATFIAAECGIKPSERSDLMVITGEEFRNMRPNDQNYLLPRLRVMARSTPQDKEKLVRMYMQQNHTVAVTGDGANDALALKEANVGLAMGIQGTDVAKEASDVVILDDSFSSIVQTVKWGRTVYDNIRKFVQFQMTINLAALVINLVGAITNKNDEENYPLSFTPLQLLWMNIIMDSGAAIAFSTEQPTEEILERKPFRKDSMLISPTMWKNIIGHALVQISILLFLSLPTSGPIGFKVFRIAVEDDKNRLLELKTCVFNTFVWFQIFNSINARRVNDELNVFKNTLSNFVFPVILVIFMVVQIFFITFLGSVASVKALRWDQWLICIGISIVSIPLGFILRAIPLKRNYGFIDCKEEGDFKGYEGNKSKMRISL